MLFITVLQSCRDCFIGFGLCIVASEKITSRWSFMRRTVLHVWTTPRLEKSGWCHCSTGKKSISGKELAQMLWMSWIWKAFREQRLFMDNSHRFSQAFNSAAVCLLWPTTACFLLKRRNTQSTKSVSSFQLLWHASSRAHMPSTVRIPHVTSHLIRQMSVSCEAGLCLNCGLNVFPILFEALEISFVFERCYMEKLTAYILRSKILPPYKDRQFFWPPFHA